MYAKLDVVYRKILNTLIFTIFSVMCLITLVNVIARFAFNSPIPWSVELARYSFIWIIFLGAALAVRNGSHIGMEFVLDKLPEKGKAFLKGAINFLMILFLGVFTIISFKQALGAADTESAAMQIPMLIPYMALPIGGIVMLIEIIRVMRAKSNKEDKIQEML